MKVEKNSMYGEIKKDKDYFIKNKHNNIRFIFIDEINMREEIHYINTTKNCIYSILSDFLNTDRILKVEYTVDKQRFIYYKMWNDWDFNYEYDYIFDNVKLIKKECM